MLQCSVRLCARAHDEPCCQWAPSLGYVYTSYIRHVYVINVDGLNRLTPFVVLFCRSPTGQQHTVRPLIGGTTVRQYDDVHVLRTI